MTSESRTAGAQNSRKVLWMMLAMGAAIMVAVTAFGPLESAVSRAPYGLLGGASFAGGMALKLWWDSRRGRTPRTAPPR